MIDTFKKFKLFLLKLFHKPQSSDFYDSKQNQDSHVELGRSRRAQDLAAEHLLTIYLDKYLYADFPTKSLFSKIKRIHDKGEQLLGTDVEFTGIDGQVYCVDEKAQLYYLNQNLPTFAFEVLFKRGINDTVGWLCNNTLKTDFYMLIWPFASQDTCNGITWDKFTKADCLLISKKKLLRMLADVGLTVERMLEDAFKIRANGQVGKIPIPGLKGIYYYASDSSKYREAPINIIVSKPLLKKLAQRRYIVTKDKIVTE